MAVGHNQDKYRMCIVLLVDRGRRCCLGLFVDELLMTEVGENRAGVGCARV